MKPNHLLTGSPLRTYNRLFEQPMTPNLGWDDVHALFRQLGAVKARTDGTLKVTRNGHVIILPVPLKSQVAGPEEVLCLRNYIERSNPAHATEDLPELQWLVVIDHHEALIYRSIQSGSVPQQIRSQVKSANHGLEKPDSNSYFEPVAGVLNGAGTILIFGNDTGAANEMDRFIAWVEQHRPTLAQRIVGSLVINTYHLTEAQILAQARDFFLQHALSPAD